MVRPELLKKRIVAMAKERTWEADTETELTNVFRKLDTLAHNGEEYGYIEMGKMQRCGSTSCIYMIFLNVCHSYIRGMRISSYNTTSSHVGCTAS